MKDSMKMEALVQHRLSFGKKINMISLMTSMSSFAQQLIYLIFDRYVSLSNDIAHIDTCNTYIYSVYSEF